MCSKNQTPGQVNIKIAQTEEMLNMQIAEDSEIYTDRGWTAGSVRSVQPRARENIISKV
jgi:hypothetical protein